MYILFYLLVVLLIGLIPASIFFLMSIFFKKRIFAKIGYGVFFLPFILLTLLSIYNFCFVKKMKLEKDDIYGEYIINRNKCAGKQANWQYNHYRFEIKKDDNLYFYIFNDNDKLIKTIKKPVRFIKTSRSPEIDINPKYDDFHILKQNPTLYREIWTFYYVFESEKYGNMFFTKKKWYN